MNILSLLTVESKVCNKHMKKNINIPFCGFYETIAGEFVDRELLSGFVSENDLYTNDRIIDEISDLTESECEKFDLYCDKNRESEYKRYIERYTELYFDGINDLLPYGVDVDFKAENITLESPKFYNYTTDRIFCDVDFEALVKLYGLTDQKKLEEIIKEKFTSYDGFISHYSNDINDPEWVNLHNFDHNQWYTLLSCWIDSSSDQAWEIAGGMSF